MIQVLLDNLQVVAGVTSTKLQNQLEWKKEFKCIVVTSNKKEFLTLALRFMTS